MPTEADSTAAAWFALFGNVHRFAIIRVLADGERVDLKQYRWEAVVEARLKDESGGLF